MTKSIRKAKGGIAEVFRKLDIGEAVAFSMEKYNPASVRNAPSATLLKDRAREGKKWITSSDMEDKCVYVLRVK